MCNSNTLKFNPFKNRLLIMFVLVLSLPSNVQSQAKDSEEKNLPELPQMVHPSKGIIIAVLSTMFAIAFLLLLYVKFCRVIPHELLRQNSNLQNFQGLTRPRSRVSGIDKQVIETLPYFKFSSLKGSKEGLECTVCLSKFEDTETLRLLPNTRFGSCPLESTDPSGRFHGTSSSNEKENSFTALNNPAEKRCMSEIANVPRFAQMGKDNWIEEQSNCLQNKKGIYIKHVRKILSLISAAASRIVLFFVLLLVALSGLIISLILVSFTDSLGQKLLKLKHLLF
ncbi:Putative RING-H2 finger protein ATL12 [Glycine soja]|nr:Putative RING-H2 finger protein ATL12 [Glycine soja]